MSRPLRARAGNRPEKRPDAFLKHPAFSIHTGWEPGPKKTRIR